MYTCVYAAGYIQAMAYMTLGTCMKVRGILARLGSLLLPYGFLGLNLGHQAWWQVTLAPEPYPDSGEDVSAIVPKREKLIRRELAWHANRK